jgi:cathepsin L
MFALLAVLSLLPTGLRAAKVMPCKCIDEYKAFQSEFKRATASTQEFYQRCNTFCANVAELRAHNVNPASTYTVKLQPLHDLTDAERVRALAMGYGRGPRDKSHDTFATDLPTVTAKTSIDWQLQGIVTDIRDQQQCGDCWAESAVVVLEASYARATDQLVQLSVEQVAECTSEEYDQGCEGGWPIDALRYVQQARTICSEHTYPTTIGSGIDNSCNATINCSLTVPVEEILSVPTGNETALEGAATLGVVSVAIDASGQGFYSYSHGVYNGQFNNESDCSLTMLDHAVAVVGLGTLESKPPIPFYLVRNSWGSQGWGDLNGYALFARGLNTCGIAQDAVFVP